MFYEKTVMMSSHDLCSKLILCKNVDKFLKYHNVINDLFKSINHEDAEVNSDVTHA
jgi:hypothetical protein